MDKKRIVASTVVFLILAVLLYLQYRHWQTFDWGTFWAQTHRIRKARVFTPSRSSTSDISCAQSAGRFS